MTSAKAFVLDRLRKSDSTLNSLRIYDFGNATSCGIEPHEYGDALSCNTALQELSIVSVNKGHTSADLERHASFFAFIERSPSLKKVMLSGETSQWPLDLLERFVVALVKNTGIQVIELENLHLPIFILKKLFRPDRNLARLILKSISIIDKHGSTACGTISEISIEQLALCDTKQADLIEFLKHKFHINVKEMFIALNRTEMSVTLAKAMEQALQEMHLLHKIQFDGVQFERIAFEQISTGLQLSRSLRKVIFSNCEFDSQSSLLFPSTFGKNELKCLEISGGRYPFKKSLESTLSSILTQSDMDSIDIVNLGIGQKLLDIATVLKPFEEKATLGNLHLGILSFSCLSDLLHGITMSRGLEQMMFHILNNKTDYEETKLKIIAAVRKNCSLKSIQFRGSGQEIEMYCHRNRDIHNWMAACESVPVSFWPFAIARAKSFEHRNEVIFKSISMLVCSVGATGYSPNV